MVAAWATVFPPAGAPGHRDRLVPGDGAKADCRPPSARRSKPQDERTDEQKSRYLEGLFEETYLKDIISRYGVAKTQELDELVNVLASSIGSLTN